MKRNILLAVLLFTTALAPRLPGLGDTMMADEQLWVQRSVNFFYALLDLNPEGTMQAGHPGVTTMWLGSAFIGARSLIGDYDWSHDFLKAGQLSIAVATALLLTIIFFYLRRILGVRIASLSFLLLVLEPFFLAHSRAIHLDALLSSLMFLGLLAFLAFIIYREKKQLIISGAFSGLAILTKLPALFLLPFMALITITAIFLFPTRDKSGNHGNSNPTGNVISIYTIWLLVITGTLFLVWPAMLTDPLLFFKLVSTEPGMAPHEHGQYFLGHAIKDPGSMFYAIVLIFRTTPITFIFFIIGTFYVLSDFARNRLSSSVSIKTALILLAYIALFVAMMTIPGKKMDRYILPVFLPLDVIAALGLIYIFEFLRKISPINLKSKSLFIAFTFLISLYQAVVLANIYPYFLAYYNPLFGGAKTAKIYLLIGRGEGLDLVAEYLNNKENPKDLVVASEFPYILNLNFVGKTITTKVEEYDPETLNKIDYLVIYIAGLQKGSFRLPQEIIQYAEAHLPEHTVSINGIDYAYIYKIRASQPK